MRDGIYFNLPEAEYHADPSLGSSSIKQLAVSPCEWWFGSANNPNRPEEKETPAQIIGSAFHCMVLYGAAEFRKRYALKEHNWATKEGKAERDRFDAQGLQALTHEDWTRIWQADGVIHANPHLAQAFRGGFCEVSIFWTDDGIPKKARLDCLKLGATVDLKTIAPKDDFTPLPTACRKAMANYAYPVQGLHYNDARAQIPRFLESGKVYGEHDAALLKKIAARSEWASVFVFLKKTDAPMTWACSLAPNNPLLSEARFSIQRAEENYRHFVERFGLNTPWTTEEPIEELHPDDLPAWRKVL